MTAGLVGQNQVATFVTPVNGTSPIDANQVKGNDNVLKTSYDAHDDDGSIHFQSSAASARPSASDAGLGAKWLDNDTFKVYYSDGSSWTEIAYMASSGDITITGELTITSTTAPQLAVRYDASNHLHVSVSSAGAVTYDATGASAGHAFSETVAVTGSVTATGEVTAGTAVTAAATAVIRWNGRAAMDSTADGWIRLANAAFSDFSLLQFGGTTSSFPALKRSSATLIARLADDSADASFLAAAFAAGASGSFGWASRSLVSSGADGVITITNNAANDFSRLTFGGTTSSFPAIKRNSAQIEARLADDSARANFLAADGDFSGDLTVTGSVTFGGAFVSDDATGGIGYTTGAGGAVTQPDTNTGKTNAVTLNTVTGAITTNNDQLIAGAIASFTVNNSSVLTDDVIHVIHASGGTAGGYDVWAHTVTNGTSFQIAIRNVTAGNLSEVLVLNYAILRGASS